MNWCQVMCIFGIMTFIFAIVWFKSEGDWFLRFFLFPSAFSLSTISVVLLVVTVSQSFIDLDTKISNYEYKIVSLNNHDQIQGRFRGNFLISQGYIDSVEYYFTFKETENGFERLKIPANSTIIKEGYDPKVVETVEYYTGGKAKFYMREREVVSRSYTLYVPKGTIVREFQLK